VIGLSERDANLTASAIELVAAARRGGDEHVTAWYDAILRRTRTPVPADVAELAELRHTLAAEMSRAGTFSRAEAVDR
jgi:hypothetical protein